MVLGYRSGIELLEFADPRLKTDEIGVDGAQWIVEGIKDGRYKVVDRWSPEKGAVRALGLTMLLDLAKLKLQYREVY